MTYPNTIPAGFNAGLCHKQSGTCCVDVDNLKRSRELFANRGLDLNRLLMSGVQISSGRENRSKLLYRLPDIDRILGNFPRTKQLAEPSGMVFEFRCVYGTGKTCQDIAPGSVHPNGNTYHLVGDLTHIPVIPPELLKWWRELIPVRSSQVGAWDGTPDTPEERGKLLRALRALDPDMSYPEWISVGMAIHDTGWEDALELWDTWSSEASGYCGWEEIEDKWDTFSRGAGVNHTWLYSQAYEVNKNWDQKSADEMFQEIAVAAPITIDNDTQQVQVDVKALCEAMEFGMPMEEMQVVFVHVAAEPEQVMREQYIRIMAAKTNLPRPVLREQVNLLRQVEQTLSSDFIQFPDTNDRGVPLTTLANFYVLLNTHQYVPAYNTMTRAVECARPLGSASLIQDAMALGTLTEIRSLCAKYGLKPESAKEYRDYMAYCNHYHPFHQFVDTQAPYDASEPDYLQQLCDSLVVSDDHRELRDTLVKTWMISVVAAAYMTWDLSKPPVRGVLVLQGPQRVGKSYWFEKLLPVGMVKVGASINKNDMNHLKTATNRLIVELAEAEFNRNNMDMVAYLKSVVGRSVDELRKAYDAEEVQLLRRSVFCISTNPGTFLVDDENSRYFTVPCLDIDRFKYNMIPMSRLWMQVKAKYDAGVPYLLDDTASEDLQELNEQHRAKSRFEQWLLDTFHFDTMDGVGSSDTKFTRTQIDIMAGNAMDVSPGDGVDILKRLTGCAHSTDTTIQGVGGRFWSLPDRVV